MGRECLLVFERAEGGMEGGWLVKCFPHFGATGIACEYNINFDWATVKFIDLYSTNCICSRGCHYSTPLVEHNYYRVREFAVHCSLLKLSLVAAFHFAYNLFCFLVRLALISFLLSPFVCLSVCPFCLIVRRQKLN